MNICIPLDGEEAKSASDAERGLVLFFSSQGGGSCLFSCVRQYHNMAFHCERRRSRPSRNGGEEVVGRGRYFFVFCAKTTATIHRQYRHTFFWVKLSACRREARRLVAFICLFRRPLSLGSGREYACVCALSTGSGHARKQYILLFRTLLLLPSIDQKVGYPSPRSLQSILGMHLGARVFAERAESPHYNYAFALGKVPAAFLFDRRHQLLGHGFVRACGVAICSETIGTQHNNSAPSRRRKCAI